MLSKRVRVPSDLTPEEKKEITTVYENIATSHVIVGGNFVNNDPHQVIATTSQRDLKANAFKKQTKIFTTNQSGEYRGVGPYIDASSTSLTNPSGKTSITIRPHTPPNSTLKQCIVEIYDNDSGSVLHTVFLDGIILTTTPFDPPSFSPCNRYVMFSFLHSTAHKQLDKYITSILSAENNDNDNNNTNQQQPPKPSTSMSLTVEQLVSDLYVDNTKYGSLRDNGEQLCGITYPYLLILDLFTGAVKPLHDPSLYAIMSPTMARWGLPIQSSQQSTSQLSPTSVDNPVYPIYFVGVPIFPQRLGTIFYTSRPSRLYVSTFSHDMLFCDADIDNNNNTKSNTLSINTSNHINDNGTILPLGQQAPSSPTTPSPPLGHKGVVTPQLYCLTPHAHCVHAPNIFYNHTTQHVEISYLEGQGYDPLWTTSNANIDLGNESSHIDPYTPVPAERLSPHNTTLAIRHINISYDYINIIITRLFQLSIAGITGLHSLPLLNVLSSLSSSSSSSPTEGNDNDILFSSELLSSLYTLCKNAYMLNVPDLYYNNGGYNWSFIWNHIVPHTQQQQVQHHPQHQQFPPQRGLFTGLTKSYTHPSPQSLLPVNLHSYGIYIAGNTTIHRLDTSTLAVNTTLRDVETVYILSYHPSSSSNNRYQSSLYLLEPPSSPTYYIDQTSIPKCLKQCTAVTQYNPNGVWYSTLTTTQHSSAHNNTISTVVPQLPVATQFNPSYISDDDKSIVSSHHTTHQSIFLLDTISPSLDLYKLTQATTTTGNNTITLLISCHHTNQLPYLTAVSINLAQLPSPVSQFISIDTVYSPSLSFHTSHPTRSTRAAVVVVDGETDILSSDLSTSSSSASSSGVYSNISKDSNIYTLTSLPPSQSHHYHVKWTPITVPSHSHTIRDRCSRISTLTYDISPYTEYGMLQALVTYDTELYSLIDHDNSPTRAVSDTVKKQRRGVILLPHGGPHSHLSSIYDFVTTTFALLGYMVIKVNYSGSTGYGEVPLRSLMGYIGLSDATECLLALDVICKAFNIQSNNTYKHVNIYNSQNTTTNNTDTSILPHRLPLSIFGGSHGGYLGSYLTVFRHFDSCIIRNPVLSLNVTGATSDITDWAYNELGYLMQPTTFWAQQQQQHNQDDNTYKYHDSINIHNALTLQSPMSHVHCIKTPTLLGIGDGDRRVPPLQSFSYQALVQQNGIPCLLNSYPGAQHSLNDTPHIHAHSICSSIAFIQRFSK